MSCSGRDKVLIIVGNLSSPRDKIILVLKEMGFPTLTEIINWIQDNELPKPISETTEYDFFWGKKTIQGPLFLAPGQ